MKTKLRFTSLALALMLSSGAAWADMSIGVSMSQFDDTWLTYLRQDMTTKASSYPASDKVNIQFLDARADVNKQRDQVQQLIDQKVDALIVNPVDTAATAQITQAAAKAGIPLVYVNRRPDDRKPTDKYITVASNDEEAGQMQMQYLADKMGGKGNIMIDQEQTAVWDRTKAIDITSNWLTQGKKFDAIASNNDEMAIGAARALKQAGVAKGSILIAGVDGTPDGLAAVTNGDLTVSVFQDHKGQADGAIDAAVKMAKKEPVEQSVWVPYRLITPENVASFK